MKNRVFLFANIISSNYRNPSETSCLHSLFSQATTAECKSDLRRARLDIFFATPGSRIIELQASQAAISAKSSLNANH